MKPTFTEPIKNIGHVAELWLPLKIKYERTPSLAVGIVYKGKLAYQKSFGFADMEQKKRATERTLYHIASISKTFTAVSIMQLVEQGKLRLDDKVTTRIGWFKAKNKNSDAAHITIRQLLSHTAGVFRDGNTPHWVTGDFPKDLKTSFSAKSLRTETLTNFKYSNYGFSLLGEIIQNVTGLSYEEYVKKNILQPLGMSSTAPDYRNDLTDVATGYGRNIPDEKRQKFPHYKTSAYAPATGFLSNVVDLSKFLAALSFESKKKLLSRESKKEMMHPYEKTGEGEEYGLGLDIFQINGRKIVGHSGGFNGFITQILLDSQNDLGVVVLSNGLNSPAYNIARGLLGFIYEFSDKRSEYMRGKKINYAAYEGIYRNAWGDEIVTRIGNTLVGFSVRNDAPLKWSTSFIPEKTKHHFMMKGKNVFDSYDEIAEFSSFKNGKAQKVVFGATPSKRI